MLISEIFLSLQGESTYAGLPCAFVRLAGCNLRCEWCDTTYARVTEGARDMTVEGVIEEIRRLRYSLIEITGGEPLIQAETEELLRRVLDDGYTVLLETNGTVDLSGVDRRVVKIIDIKCPSSGHAGSFKMENLSCIGPDDEVKFVIADREDYEFAKRCREEVIGDRTEKILFAPVRKDLPPATLAGWILKDMLRVRLQLQIHSYIWKEQKGK